jgi:nitrogenase-associated protein
MTAVIFYEKPGCINNTKQKAMLMAAGHEVQACNLLKTPWTPESLRPFFGNLPVSQWFNGTAPRIKSGEINPAELDEQTALALMIADPILIRRPLIQVGDIFEVGFNLEKIDAWIGLNPVERGNQDLETCPRSHETTPCKSPV